MIPQKIEKILSEYFSPLDCLEGFHFSEQGVLTIALKTTEKDLDALKKELNIKLKGISDIKEIRYVLTSHKEGKPLPSPSFREKEPLEGVEFIIAVASGKGGVGKSTIAVNLALGLSHLGLRVGLLDGDIYGPSLPRLLDLKEPPQSEEGKRIIPLEKYGLKCLSIGLMVPNEDPLVWRGLMVQSALTQLLKQTTWEPLDVLVVDMPPGTGDAHLTLSQVIPLDGAVIVSTPQDIALLDARKSMKMFHKVEIPLLGLIENMSYYLCPSCGHQDHIFDHGGAKKEADQWNIPFLGEIPLDPFIRTQSDQGIPVVKEKNSLHAPLFLAMAEKIWEALNTHRNSLPK